MRGSKTDLPVALEDDGVVLQHAEWGGLNVAIERMPAGLDLAPLLVGLPDDRCQCPHWGYMIKGRMRVRYADREEVVQAGDVYYLPPGHVVLYEEESEYAEFSPSGPYAQTLEVAGRNYEAMKAGAGAAR